LLPLLVVLVVVLACSTTCSLAASAFATANAPNSYHRSPVASTHQSQPHSSVVQSRSDDLVDMIRSVHSRTGFDLGTFLHRHLASDPDRRAVLEQLLSVDRDDSHRQQSRSLQSAVVAPPQQGCMMQSSSKHDKPVSCVGSCKPKVSQLTPNTCERFDNQTSCCTMKETDALLSAMSVPLLLFGKCPVCYVCCIVVECRVAHL
jgi:hypothetical protein